jgi:two-component system, response regulator PdtaR
MACPRKDHNAPVVLVVEDEMLTRILTVAAFDDAGFVVMEADGARQALAILEANAQFIQVLFTDIDMPGGMNGVFLALRARERWPWVGIAMTSGEALPGATALPDHTRFFPKPYNTDGVVTHIREMALATE